MHDVSLKATQHRDVVAVSRNVENANSGDQHFAFPGVLFACGQVAKLHSPCRALVRPACNKAFLVEFNVWFELEMFHDIVDVVENFGLFCECFRPVRIQIKGVGIVLPSSSVNKRMYRLPSKIVALSGMAHTWESTSQLRLG